ncbi:MAG: TM2 domain-containing protein [Kofleriaceae bacterium]
MAPLPAHKKHCFACANILDARAELCPKCGIRQPDMVALEVQRTQLPTKGTRNKTTAGLFALLLGGLGIHRFYLGHTGMGVLYLLFCWTFIPAIAALIEGILYLTMTDEAFAQKYG